MKQTMLETANELKNLSEQLIRCINAEWHDEAFSVIRKIEEDANKIRYQIFKVKK